MQFFVMMEKLSILKSKKSKLDEMNKICDTTCIKGGFGVRNVDSFY